MGFHASQDVYAPCECGSGKKYKFCCLSKDREERNRAQEQGRAWRGVPPSFMDLEEGERFHELGMRHLEKGRAEKAIPFFEESIRLVPVIPEPHNNLALCHFQLGNADRAIEIAERIDREIDPGNTFTLGSLVQFYRFMGRDEKAQRVLERLKARQPKDHFACIKKCEALARFKAHEEILACALPFASTGPAGLELSFFAGTALANLSRLDEAFVHLSRARNCPVHSERARRYLKWITRRTAPDTVDGDWPYLEGHEWMSPGLIRNLLERKEAQENSFPGVVECLVASLNDDPKNREHCIRAISAAGTDRAKAVLRKIAFGMFGTDSERMTALKELRQLGGIQPEEPLRVWISGQWQDVKLELQCLDPEAVSPLPTSLAPVMQEMVKAMKAGRLAEAEEIGRALLERAREYASVHYNVSRIYMLQGRNQDEEKSLQTACSTDPSYLFAPAMLAMNRVSEGRLEEAKEILKKVVLPANLHPSAYCSFLAAQAHLSLAERNFEGAEKAIGMIKKIEPENELLRPFESEEVSKLLKLAVLTRRVLREENENRRGRILDREAGLERCFECFPRSELCGITEKLRVDPDRHAKLEALIALTALCLRDGARVRRGVDELPAPAREALAALSRSDGLLTYEEFTKRFGSDAEELKLPGAEAPRSALGWLKAFGLVVEATVAGRQSVMVPREVLNALQLKKALATS